MATYNYSNYYKIKSPTGYDIYNTSGSKLSYEQALPMFQSGFNVDYIQEKPTTQTQLFQPTTSTPTQTQPIQQAPKPTQLFQTSAPAQAQTNIGQTGYYKDAQNNVYTSSGQHVTLDQFKAANLNIDHIPLQSGEQKQPELSSADYMKYYEGLSGKQSVDTAKSEYDTARTDSDTAFLQGQTQIQGLIEGSQKLFNDLFNSPELAQAKDAQARAFGELQKLDAEEAKAIQNVKEEGRAGGTVRWAIAGRLGIIAEGFNAQKAGYLAQEAIANNAIEKGYQYAEQAYNANLATLNAKIQLVQNVIDRAKTLSDDEKAEYQDVLARAQELYKTRQGEQEQSLDLYMQLAQLGVGGINPTMSVSELARIAGPTLVQQAKDKIALEERLTQAEIAAKNRSNQPTTTPTDISPYRAESIQRMKQSVEELMGRVSGSTVGFAGLFSGVPSSDAKDFSADLDTLKANIAFDALTAMREASKTGGALGQVSERELALLEATLASLDQKQSPENFSKNLQKIEDSINRWLEAASLESGGTSVNDPLGIR